VPIIRDTDRTFCLKQLSVSVMRRSISLLLCTIFLVTLLYAPSHGQDASCTFSVSPVTIHFFNVAGGTAEVQVKASGPQCTFNARTKYLWITVSIRQEGGIGKVSVTVDANDVPIYRVGSVSIDGWEVAIIQDGPRESGGG
jgi:hypothetical protein